MFIKQLKQSLVIHCHKDVANDYSKGSTDAYPTDIHKALTLMNEYKPLKLDTPTIPIPAQGTAFATKGTATKKRAVTRVLQLEANTSRLLNGMR